MSGKCNDSNGAPPSPSQREDRLLLTEDRRTYPAEQVDGADGSPRNSGGHHLHLDGRPHHSRAENEMPEDSSSLRDSFGMVVYDPLFMSETQMEKGRFAEILVPWRLRHPRERDRCFFFTFLVSRQFWWHVEFALRITLIAVLTPAALIALDLSGSPFVSYTFAISATVLAAKTTVGESFVYLATWVRAGALWWPLATIGASIHLDNSIAGWCVFYVAMLFVMAVLTENMVRRICLLLFNICMVSILINPARGVIYPSRVMLDWCIGTGLCVVAIFVPYPVFSRKRANRHVKDIATGIGTGFHGITSSFWAASYTERNLAMAKVRLMTTAVDSLFPKFEHEQANSFYEFLFESPETRELRAMKVKLFAKLRVNLSSMVRVLDMVEAKPWIVDLSERSQAFSKCLNPYIAQLALAVDELLDRLSVARKVEDIRKLQPTFRLVRDRMMELEKQYNVARLSLFYECPADTLEEFVPLMTFFIFSIANFHETIEVFDFSVVEQATAFKSLLYHVLDRSIFLPMRENMNFFHTLVAHWRRKDVQRIIEAAKVSFAMILTIGFSFLIKIDKESFSGPNIIAFVSGSNPVEAVQASVVRLTGCLLGTVLGFFAGSYSTTTVDKVASLCVLMFVLTFMRHDPEYGIMSVYAMFVLIPLDSVAPTTTADTIARMNQNTFGIFIYCFISIVILPLSPSHILLKKRANILLRMSTSLLRMMDLFSAPMAVAFHKAPSVRGSVPNLGSGNGNMTAGAAGGPREGDAVVYSHPENEIRGSGSSDNSREGSGDTVAVEVEAAVRVGTSGTELCNASIIRSMKLDPIMNEIGSMIADIELHITRSAPFMGFAHSERGLVDTYYPVKSCEAIHLRLHRMLVLLNTMWYCWSFMRTQIAFSPQTLRLMHNLQPVARDVGRAFSKFAALVVHSLMDPVVILEKELLEASLAMSDCAEQLHRRKSKIILVIVHDAVSRYRLRKRRQLQQQCQQPYPQVDDGEFASAQQQPRSHQLQSPDSRSPTTSPATFDEACAMYIRNRKRRDAETERAQGAPIHHPRAPVRPPGTFRVFQSDQNVSIATQVGSTESPLKMEEALDDIPLEEDFHVPMTSKDVECLHSLTLCLKMFAEECKQLLVALEEMLEWQRRLKRA